MATIQPIIILIETELNIVKEIEGILTPRNFKIISVDEGKKGVEFCRSASPNLVILGFDRNPDDATFVIEALSKDTITSKIPILGLYSTATRYEIEKDRKRGVIDHISKPINKYQLINKVKELMEYSAEMKSFSINSRKHHITIETPLNNLIKISFKSGLKKYVLPEFKNYITPEFMQSNKDKNICIDIRDFTELSEEEIVILDKIAQLFKDKKISIIVGKHMGIILSNSNLEEKVNLFISIEDFVVFLKKQAAP